MITRTSLSLTVALLVLSFASDASAKWEIWELGIESAIPTGEFGDIAGEGGGLSLNIVKPVNHFLCITGYAGVLRFGNATARNMENQWYGFPISVGGVSYVRGMEEKGIFLKANFGLLRKVGTIEVGGDEKSKTQTGFVLSPGVGYDFGKLIVTTEYNLGDDDWTWFAIRAAHRFDW